MQDGVRASTRSRLTARPIFIVSVYLAVSAVWIAVSDTVVFMLVSDGPTRTSISIVKGMGFIILTSILLFYLVSKGFRSLERSQRDLRENEGRLRAMFESSPYGIIERDQDGKVLFSNARANDILGLGTRELDGTRMEHVVGSDGRSWDEVPYALVVQGSQEKDIMVRLKGGGHRWVRVISTGMQDREDAPRTLEMFSDITERVQAARELQHRADQMDALFQVSRELIGSRLGQGDLDGICVTAVERLGATSAWIAVLNDLNAATVLAHCGPVPDVGAEVMGGDMERRTLWTVDGHAGIDWGHDLEVRSFGNDGTSLAVVPLSESGKVVGIMGFGHEGDWAASDGRAPFLSLVNLTILALQKVRMLEALRGYTVSLEGMVSKRTAELTTMARQMEAEVRRTREAQELLYREMEKLSITLHSIGEGVVVTDVDGNIQMANRMAKEFFASGAEAAIGSSLSAALPLQDPKTLDRLDSFWRSNIDRNKAMGGKAILLNNGRKEVHFNSSPIKDQEGGLVGYVVVFRDITTEVQLQDAKERAEKLEAIGHLAGDLAHSFNNALTAILGNMELLDFATPDNDPAKEYIQEGQSAIVRAMGLTSQLLTFAKGGEPIRKRNDPVRILDRVGQAYSEESGMEVRIITSGDVWDVNVDEMQMVQALSRLMYHLGRIGDHGSIEAEVRNWQEEDPTYANGQADLVLIRIERPHPGARNGATGPPLYSAGESQGIDLTIAQSIIGKHDGRMSLGVTTLGLVFEIYLPALRQEVRTEATALPDKEKASAKVLVMDDDQDILEVVSDMLRIKGHRADLAHDGAEALAMYEKALALAEPYDVLIMDLNVPGGMGGREAVRILNERHGNVRAIVSSGYSNDPIMANHSAFGFKGVLPKPYTLKQLDETVRRTSRAK